MKGEMNKMERNLLPIGSVVLLEGGEKRLMICGRIQVQGNSDIIYDYSGCLFPEGITSSDSMYFFNNDAIEMVYFIGFQDEEELAFREFLNSLGELELKDGVIVEKEA